MTDFMVGVLVGTSASAIFWLVTTLLKRGIERTKIDDVDMAKYSDLSAVFYAATLRAAVGKGKERHATDENFKDQLIVKIPQAVGLGFNKGQAIKKIIESERRKPKDQILELLDSIVYLAGAIIYITTKETHEDTEPAKDS